MIIIYPVPPHPWLLYRHPYWRMTMALYIASAYGDRWEEQYNTRDIDQPALLDVGRTFYAMAVTQPTVWGGVHYDYFKS